MRNASIATAPAAYMHGNMKKDEKNALTAKAAADSISIYNTISIVQDVM
jgi:hypothetical protein